MLLAISFTLLLIAILAGILRLAGIKFANRGANPFGLFVVINFFIVSLPGIVMVAFPSVETFLNVGDLSVSSASIVKGTQLYIASLIIIFSLILMSAIISGGFKVLSVSPLTPYQRSRERRFLLSANLANVVFMLFLFLYIGWQNIPLLQSILGDVVEGHVLKAKLITGEIEKPPESINQIFRILVPLTAYLWAYRYFSVSNKKKEHVLLQIRTKYF